MVWDLIMPVPLASIVITTFALMFDNFTGFAFLWLIPLAGLLHVCVYTRKEIIRRATSSAWDRLKIGFIHFTLVFIWDVIVIVGVAFLLASRWRAH